jgi:hypothetical protein
MSCRWGFALLSLVHAGIVAAEATGVPPDNRMKAAVRADFHVARQIPGWLECLDDLRPRPAPYARLG